MPYLFIILILVGVLVHNIRKSSRKEARDSADFWEREQKSFTVPRQSTDDIHFITITDDIVPLPCLDGDEEINDLIARLNKLKGLKIADLSQYTNTDLRMKYGAPNFNELSSADNNCTELVIILSHLIPALIKANRPDEARLLIRFASDNSLSTSAIRNAAELLEQS